MDQQHLHLVSRSAEVIVGVVLGIVGLFCLAIAAGRIVLVLQTNADLTNSIVAIMFFLVLGVPAALYGYRLVSGRARLHPPRSPLVWALLGLLVGFFWLVFMWVFFTAPQSLFVSVSEVIANITCPPLLLDNLFAAPLLNGVLYGVLAFGVRALLRHIGARSTGPPAAPPSEESSPLPHAKERRGV